MSFLNSVLSSLNDGSTPLSVPKVTPSKHVNTGSNGTQSSSKRKAENDMRPNSGKLAKFSGSKPLPEPIRSTAAPSSRGRIRESVKTLHRDGGMPKRHDQFSTVSTAKAPPKKGSFAEILARGNQNKSSTPFSGITHKPKEKLSAKKELALEKEARKNKKPINKVPLNTAGSKATATSTGKDTKIIMKETRTIGYHGTGKSKTRSHYQGTMNSKPQGTYAGTMKSKTQDHQRKGYDNEPGQVKHASSSKVQRSEHYSEAESEGSYGASDDGYDYASEDYSDMDAGFEDMEDEDAEALRVAKREDAAEQRALDELKRQKEEKKRKLHVGGR